MKPEERRETAATGVLEQSPLWPRRLGPLGRSLAQHLADDDLTKTTLRLIQERAPDEQLALAFLIKLLEESHAPTVETLGEPALAADLVFCLGASELVGIGLTTMGPQWRPAFQDARASTAAGLVGAIRFDLSSPPLFFDKGGSTLGEEQQSHALQAERSVAGEPRSSAAGRGPQSRGETSLPSAHLKKQSASSVSDERGSATSEDVAQMTQQLAQFKSRMFLAIIIADLLGRLTVADTVSAMSRLADECICAALRIATVSQRARVWLAEDFCVIAMGKLGAGELNLSSDIDLMYVFGGPDDAERQDEARRLGETLTEILSTNCFRVDMRLRPGGRNSPLVISLATALNFYGTLGQTWERAALLRARPVAGALGLGNRLISELSRFIYRSYLDFDTLGQLRAMKRRIEDGSRAQDFLTRDVKLGYGGIRELEFIVQALTLIYGGRDPRLRTAQTLGALERLETHGYMRAERARELAAAYLFLRNVEHKLQVAAGLQTHRLPPSQTQIAVLAARLGFGKDPDAALAFTRTLASHRNLVATVFREMLAGGETRSQRPASSAAVTAWREALDPRASAPALEQLGFANPEQSANQLVFLVCGPERVPIRPRRQELLEALGPRLLDEICALPDPDQAMLNLASFISAVGAHTSFLALLEEHPATRRMLLRLFASSSYLSTIFIRHPDMLDTLVRSDLAHPRRPLADLERELAELFIACSDFESRLDALRAFGHQEFLRIAIADLAGNLSLDEVQVELTNLAEILLRQALVLAREEVASRHPIPPELKLCVIAMGRLGAGEMSYNSDLDLIFVYHLPNEIAAGGHEIASRIMQKLIVVLEARTREGYAYKLDLRLRPSGNSGPLVTSLQGFCAYHRQSSAVWERQALVRGRVIAGAETLAQEIEQAREEFVFGRPLKPSEVVEIAAMRARMESEIGAENQQHLNLKQGRGGLVDVEFITQMMALRYGHNFAQLRRRNTLELIRAMGQAGLVDADAAAALEADYLFLLRLENRLRIETDQPAWALPIDDKHLTPIARRMGLDGGSNAARLLYEVEERRSRIRALFQALFAREQRELDGKNRVAKN
jgi:[glutamine synthetase] adenylyltransferase / [glutamine synthetase]-adenylyl-L-tyrosine phosphorylase